jgi:hypothetical protein
MPACPVIGSEIDGIHAAVVLPLPQPTHRSTTQPPKITGSDRKRWIGVVMC